MARLESAFACLSMASLLLFGACSVAGYSPCPLDLPHKLPADAFARCRYVLLSHYDTIEYSDSAAFRLETAWQPIADPPGERRASVYRDEQHPESLAIVVELRRLTIPLIGVPHWKSVRGDEQSERQLAEWLRESLRDPEVIGVPSANPEAQVVTK